MISTKMVNGVHTADRNEKFEADTLKLLKDQDLNYVTYLKQVNLKKLEKNVVLPQFAGKHVKFDQDTDGSVVASQARKEPDPVNTKEISPEMIEQIKIARLNHLKLIKSRLDRVEKLDAACRELTIQKHLVQKGRKKKVGTDDKGLPIYKWKGVRQK
jgi:U3 small nucleolar RNA-associated protein 11